MKKTLLIIFVLIINVAFSQNYNLKIEGYQLILENTTDVYTEFNTPTLTVNYKITPEITGDKITFYSDNLLTHVGSRNGYIISNIVDDASASNFNTSTIVYFMNSQTGYNSSPVGKQIIINQFNVVSEFSNIDSTKTYFIDGPVTISSSIEVPSGGITITGLGFGVSKLINTSPGFVLFSSPVGGSGNIFLEKIDIEVSGTGSSVYNVFSLSGNEAVEVNALNYTSCTSLGVIDNYRQILEQNTGRFGGTPELELRGVMNGCRISTSIVRDLSNITALFKAGPGLTFSGRFVTDINCDLPALGALIDFSPANFINNESLIINNALISRLGNTDSSDTATHPNISETSVKSYWKNNTGFTNTDKYLNSIITAETETVISVIDTYYPLLGTWNLNEISHFDMPSNGEFRLLSGNGSYRLFADIIIVGTANDVIDLRITKSTDNGVTYPTEISHIKRQINSLVGLRDVAFFPISFITRLKENDRIRIEAENKTSTNNVTAELDSYIIINQ